MTYLLLFFVNFTLEAAIEDVSVCVVYQSISTSHYSVYEVHSYGNVLVTSTEALNIDCGGLLKLISFFLSFFLPGRRATAANARGKPMTCTMRSGSTCETVWGLRPLQTRTLGLPERRASWRAFHGSRLVYRVTRSV